jgi:AcrR family transcriptional regulator
MSAPRKTRPARQARSRASLLRLISAAREILNAHGLEGATIPRIAAKAGLSPANVYRRFADKDALLQEVFLQFVEHIDDDMQKLADPAHWRGRGLAAMVRSIVADQLEGLRVHAGLLRALTQYARRNADAPFVRRVQAAQLRTFERMVALYLTRADEIHHPDPAYAVRFGTTLIGFGLRDFVLGFRAKPDVASTLGYSEKRLEEEMTQVFLRYLQVKE